MYLEPWHADIMSFVDLAERRLQRESHRDLFLALWVPDPCDAWRAAATGASLSERGSRLTRRGAEFDELYERYEREGRYREKIPAQQLMNRIIDAQIETGTRTSCTRTLQTRRATSATSSSSRPTLCAEIIGSSSEEVAVATSRRCACSL
jgi:ribonucleoside-diphosphate reductase subunit M1